MRVDFPLIGPLHRYRKAPGGSPPGAWSQTVSVAYLPLYSFSQFRSTSEAFLSAFILTRNAPRSLGAWASFLGMASTWQDLQLVISVNPSSLAFLTKGSLRSE